MSTHKFVWFLKKCIRDGRTSSSSGTDEVNDSLRRHRYLSARVSSIGYVLRNVKYVHACLYLHLYISMGEFFV